MKDKIKSEAKQGRRCLNCKRLPSEYEPGICADCDWRHDYPEAESPVAPAPPKDSFQSAWDKYNGKDKTTSEAKQESRPTVTDKAGNELDLRYCTCVTCGEKMWLAYDKTNLRYLALCDPCGKITELPDDPKFTN